MVDKKTNCLMRANILLFCAHRATTKQINYYEKMIPRCTTSICLSVMTLVLSALILFVLLFLTLVFDVVYRSMTLKTTNFKHVNPHDFSYVLNPGWDICGSDSDLTLIAVVPSSPENGHIRKAIRNTWANRIYFKHVRAVFLLGMSNVSSVNEAIREESQLFGDIVQEDFFDSYRNLTLKTVMGMRWISTYCKNAKFAVKIDDDVIMNTHYVHRYLGSVDERIKNTFFCIHIWWAVPDRTSSKWSISTNEYANDTFPSYCDGPAYMFTNDLSNKIFGQSLRQKLIYLEDVSVGILAKTLNADFVELREKYRIDKNGNLSNKSVNDYLFIYTASLQKYLDIWNQNVKQLT